MADQKKRIIELEELTTLTDNDYIAVDNSASGGETKKFKPKNLQDATNQVLKDVAYMEWENTDYYIRGDIVAYDGYIYVCKVDEATHGSFVSSDWKKTFVERWGRDLFFDISSQEMTFSDSEYTLPYSKGDVVYRYYPHPSNDGFQMRFYVAKADYPNGVTEYVASQWDEYYSLSEVVDALNKETNKSVDEALVEGTASGEIASFTDGSTLPMKKLEVDIEPVQSGSGEPSPTNVRPISGWDECNVGVVGKNLINRNGTDTNNGYINQAYLSDNGSVGSDANLFVTEYFRLKPNTTYFLSGVSGSARSYCLYDKYKNYISGEKYQGRTSFAITTTQNTSYIRLTLHKSESGEQLAEGSTATTYEPYNGQTYTIDLDGTRYGGKLDVVNGELVVTNIYAIFNGSENWSYYRSDGSTSYNAFQTNILAKFGVAILEAWSGDTRNNALCDSYICNGGTVYNHNDNAFAIDSTSVYFSTNVANTVEAFKTYINEHNIGLLATLATPQIIQLTPTEVKSLLATNNVFADTGDILDATYVRNANITINDLIRRIETLENA